MYEAISDGQLLHPDEEEESDSGEDPEFNPVGGLAMSTQIRFDSDGQVCSFSDAPAVSSVNIY